jgi:hypothetical protein
MATHKSTSLKSNAKIRTALHEFLIFAEKALCNNDEEKSAALRGGRFYSTGDRTWAIPRELSQKRNCLLQSCLSVLSASETSEEELEEAMWGAAAKGSQDEKRAFVFEKLELARTIQRRFIGPNRLFMLVPPVTTLEIGRVSIASTMSLNTESHHLILRIGDRDDLQIDDRDNYIIEFPEVAWNVTLRSSIANVREEALWDINIATSLIRLGLIHRRVMPKALFPNLGDTEASPLEKELIRRDRGIVLSSEGSHFEGRTSLSRYQIDIHDVDHFKTINLREIGEIVFDAPKQSLAERVKNGLGWMTLARQTLSRAERFIHFFTAIEALLTHNDPTAPVTQTIARFISCILATNFSTRVAIADVMKKLYSKRSSLIHGGKRSEIHLTDVKTIQKMAEVAYIEVIIRVRLDIPSAQFIADLDRASYGAEWPRAEASGSS